MRVNERIDGLDILIPVSLELDWPTKDTIVADIREQYKRYGFHRFVLAAPSGGWRSVGYPSQEVFRTHAVRFAQIQDELKSDGIECGWWITATLKSGHSDDFTPMVDENGENSPFFV